MYGADLFAIKVDGKIVAEERGGYFLIALAIHRNEIDLDYEMANTYIDQRERYEANPDDFKVFDSLTDYAERGSADVLFYSTPKELWMMDKGAPGKKRSIRAHLRRKDR